MSPALQLSVLQNGEGKYSVLKKPSKQVTFKLKKRVKFLPTGSRGCSSLMEFFTVYFFLK